MKNKNTSPLEMRHRNILKLHNKGWERTKTDKVGVNYSHPDVDAFTIWMCDTTGLVDPEYETNMDNVTYHWSEQILDHMPHHLNT